MANLTGGGGIPLITTEPIKRCTVCNVPLFIPELIQTHYNHHRAPKLCLVVSSDEDGNQKYIELTQQQALAYNAGLLPIIQTSDGGQQQYILADQGNNFKAYDANGQQLITTAYTQQAAATLGTEVEMVHYVDSAGNELSPEEVQYYALDGQEYSVIQANEEIVVSTEAAARLGQQQVVAAAAMPTVTSVTTASNNRSRSRTAPKRKSTASTSVVEPASKTFASRRGGGVVQQHQNGSSDSVCKKLLMSRDSPPSYMESTKVQNSLQQQGKQVVTSVGGINFNHLQPVPSQHTTASKLKPEPELITPDVVPNLTTTSVKQTALKLEQRPGEQQQQYIVLAYDNNGGLHHYEHTTAPTSDSKATSQSFDIKEEKLSV